MSLKHFYFRALIRISIPACVFAFYTVSFAGTCPNGTLSLWSLEESAAPYSDWVLSNNATCTSQCPTRISDGVVTAANRFQAGTNTGLSVQDSSSYNWDGGDSFSIELWVRRSTAAGSDQVLIGRTDGEFSWNISVLSAGTIGFTLSNSSGTQTLESSKVLSTDASSLGARWHHVAVVRAGDSEETRLYLDGQQVASGTQSFQNGFSSDSAALAIGWSGDSSVAMRFTGDLDEIALYQRALGVVEIRSHYYLARHYCEVYDYPVDIMPLGNSITYDNYGSLDTRAEGDKTGYRYPLWQNLRGNLYWFDFIGSEYAGYNIDDAFDADNAGFPGIMPGELLDLLQTSFNAAPTPAEAGYYVGDATSDTPYLPEYSSDVILLHIGTNGLPNNTISEWVGYVSEILDYIDNYSNNITVVLARIIHRVDDFPAAENEDSDSTTTHQYNDSLAQMVAQRVTNGDKLLMVDMEDGAGIDYTIGVDMVDNLHPNSSGYTKMADQWFDRLDDFLPQVVNPTITSSPVEEATAGGTYEYQVTAGGTPVPTFSLENAPDGMTIGADSGLISWTVPNSIGTSVNVTVVAQSIDSDDVTGTQTDSQEFTVTIVENSDVISSNDDDGDDDNSSGGCFIQSLPYAGEKQTIEFPAIGLLLLFGSLMASKQRVMKIFKRVPVGLSSTPISE
ncbi:MAG: hypothetical protein PVI90_14375 [Desulfobacteraceae bacterium]